MTIWILSVAIVAVFVTATARAPRGTPRIDGVERVLFVDVTTMTGRVGDEIDANPELGWRVLGVVGHCQTGDCLPVGPWLGPLGELEAVIQSTKPTRIVVGSSVGFDPPAERALLDARLHGITVEHVAETLELVTGKLPIERLSPRRLLFSSGFQHSDLAASDTTLATRFLSVAIALVGLIVLAPVGALLALAIKLGSRGPVFFIQRRIGMNGRPFGLVKFRTMSVAPAKSEWVTDNVHRITSVGRWLRRFRLDELPQLLNVIRGEMNLVGPRPHPVSNAQLFLANIPHYRLRMTVRPGITGWAQIRYGYANGLAEETEKMRYDLYYLKHRSFWFDMRILVATFAVLAFDRRSHEAARTPSAPAWRPRALAAERGGAR